VYYFSFHAIFSAISHPEFVYGSRIIWIDYYFCILLSGKELQKMKVLNVLNKLSPTDALPLPTQPASVRHLAFPPR
jgi:hypothetical protein